MTDGQISSRDGGGETKADVAAPELSVPAEIIDALEAAQIDLRNPQNQLIVQTVYEISAHFGGWPPAELVAACEKSAPGSSRRLFDLVGEALKHRRETLKAEAELDERLTNQEMRQDFTIKLIGLVSGAITALAGVIVAGWIAASKPESAGYLVATVIVVACIGGPPAARLLLEWITRRNEPPRVT